MKALTLAEISARLGGEVIGDSATRVSRIGTLENAGEGAIAFLSNPKYQKLLKQTGASAVILAPEFCEASRVPCIATAQPYLYFARLAQWLNPRPAAEAGLHAQASSDSQIPVSVSVAAGARVGRGVVIGDDVVIGANCVIGDDVHIGSGSLMHAGCIVARGTRIGRRAIVHSGVVIGADGFGFARDADRSWVKIPQTGAVRIGDDVEVGANSCVDRGAIDDTIIEDGVKLDNLVQIAHNVRIGAHTAIAACVGIAGSTVIGKRCTISGASSILGHLEIVDDVNVSFASVVSRSISMAGTYTGTVPSLNHDDWKRNYVQLRHLDSMADKIRSLEKRLAELEKSK